MVHRLSIAKGNDWVRRFILEIYKISRLYVYFPSCTFCREFQFLKICSVKTSDIMNRLPLEMYDSAAL